MVKDARGKRIDLRALFRGLQGGMMHSLGVTKDLIQHPVYKGDETELDWMEMLRTYLPQRYEVEKGIIIDSEGSRSEQIDLIIFDRHYSPFLFKRKSVRYLPAESVYAVFEVKPTLNKKHIEYAKTKTKSVRRLYRTSLPIPYVEGVLGPKTPGEIIAGILAYSSDWDPPFARSFKESVSDNDSYRRMNLGCALDAGGFELTHDGEQKLCIHHSCRDDSLVFFFVKLLSSLQKLASVPMIDINAYAKNMNSHFL
jgi:hypothetical protein